MNLLAASLTLVPAVFFLGMGAYALARPSSILTPFGVIVESADARAEVRAVYGGFGLAVAGLLAFAFRERGAVGSAILMTIAVATLGMAVGRVVSRLVDRPPSLYPTWFYFGVEVAAAASLSFAAYA